LVIYGHYIVGVGGVAGVGQNIGIGVGCAAFGAARECPPVDVRPLIAAREKESGQLQLSLVSCV